MLSGSEASGLTNRAVWPTSDASLPLSMTREGTFFRCFAAAQHDTSENVFQMLRCRSA